MARGSEDAALRAPTPVPTLLEQGGSSSASQVPPVACPPVKAALYGAEVMTVPVDQSERNYLLEARGCAAHEQQSQKADNG